MSLEVSMVKIRSPIIIYIVRLISKEGHLITWTGILDINNINTCDGFG
jgi:hypothetical protein